MKTLTKKIMCLAILSATTVGVANAKSVSILAETDIDNSAIQAIKTMPYNASVRVPFDGYVKITVPEEFSDQVVSSLNNSGVDAQLDVVFEVKRAVSDTSNINSGLSTTQSVDDFNDPRITEQFNIENNGIIQAMSYERLSTEPDSSTEEPPKVSIVIVDSGFTAHEDVVVSGGYSYVSEELSDELTETPRDEADYSDIGIPYDSGETCISGHGLAMAGVMAAEQQNFVGIAGIVDADLYMARVIQTDCSGGVTAPMQSGSLSDLAEAMNDFDNFSDSGIPLPGVVNISLSAKSPCLNYIQVAIDRLVDQGTVVVTSSGNDSDLASDYTPGNCNNVINVGSHDLDGYKNTFSNKDETVSLTALGQQFTTISNERYGFNYGVSTGTSGAAATVSAASAMLKEKFPSITPKQVSDVLKLSSTPYPEVSGDVADNQDCTTGCGAGMLNLFEAIKLAEKLVEPTVTFKHAFDDGDGSLETAKSDRRVEVLDGLVGPSCNTAIATITSPHLDADTLPVEYAYKVQFRATGTTTWKGVGEVFVPESVESQLPIVDFESGYEYAVTTCYENGDSELVCPSSQARILNTSAITYPDYCTN